ncbi:ferritin-like domain-containing protein [Pseudomonas schmalbachii]|uniref:Ferritin n=1 Tax=Pseudomonas schmalbachii TaxID=2816993 RepID=A0ABS3TJT5_9PSED|nr:ferritin [Pseudomonas schmalbachii]MBO3273919.1 ferritin [Pseudomonas schmalbachii]
MRNYDESILRSRQLQPAAPFPILHQAVRIALYDEYAARSFYARVIEAFGPRPPFPAILQSEERHIQALSGLASRLGIPRPLDPFPAETAIEPTWLANCMRAVVGESANVRLYDYLLAHVGVPEVRRVFLDLQAASFANHLPEFRQAASDAFDQERYHAGKGVLPQEAYASHGPLSDFTEYLIAHLSGQGGVLGLAGPLLRRVNPALLAGVAVGGGSVYLWKKRKIAKPEEEN